MSRSFEFDATDRFTAGAVGEPGARVFFIQAEQAGDRCTLLAEKEQIAILAQALLQLVDTLAEAPEGIEPSEAELDLDEPLDPEWRAGELSIQYDEDADRIAVVISEMQPDDDERDEDEESDGNVARFVISRAQARAMAGRALEIVAAGRPRCQFCGLPLEPDGAHVCPSMNGHRTHTE